MLLRILVAVLVQTRGVLAASDRRTHRLVLAATEYTVQTLYHGVLLFLLPAYWAATTLTSYNVIFLLLLVALTSSPPSPWASRGRPSVSVDGIRVLRRVALRRAQPRPAAGHVPPAWRS